MRLTRRLPIALLLTLLIPAGGVRAELDEAEWKQVTKGLRSLTGKPGNESEKRERIGALGRDDSQRAVELLFAWAASSDKLKRGKLVKAVLSTEKKLRDLERKLEKRHKGRRSDWSDKEKKEHGKRDAAFQKAQSEWTIESEVDRALAEAVAATTDDAAWQWALTEGLAKLQSAKYVGAVYRVLFQGLETRRSPEATAAVLSLIRGPAPPATRVRALDWVGAAKPDGTYAAALTALGAKPVVVRRAAVRCLQSVDDPRAVEHLITAIEKASGLLAVEIDQVLFWFTGLTLEADGPAWRRWWTEHGEGFKAKTRHRRKERRGGAHDTTFYGISSPSKRIVFILDHSGSMLKPARGLDATTGKPRPGGNRMEHAIKELRRAIKNLAEDVRFNVVFYNSGVTVWRKPRTLAPATEGNKTDVLLWLNNIEAEGTTSLFEALHKSLEYTDDFGGDARYADPGVDTVYLLTDGSPTDVDGNELRPRQLDMEMLRFLAANEVHRLVVHTVGIGRGHNRMLMERLAEKTGGKYARVVPE